MSDVQDRLNRLRQAGRLQRRSVGRAQPPSPGDNRTGQALDSATDPAHLSDLTELPGTALIENRSGTYLRRTVRYALDHQQGATTLGALLDLPGIPATALGGDEELGAIDMRQVAFVDTETSGLAGGTGTIVFLTGVGTFEEDGFVVRQYFARTPVEEPAYLTDLGEQLVQTHGYVSFNGKAFDMPLLRTRFIVAGLSPLDMNRPHLDLLHPARRLWRTRLGGCNFGHLEQRILGYQRSQADVPSWLIPHMWFRYARGENNTGDMERVLYHNLEDVVSMVSLAQAICGIFAGVVPPHPDDRLSLAHSYARRGLHVDAERVYRDVLEDERERAIRMDALAGLTAVMKRSGDRKRAAIWWQAWAEMDPPQSVHPHVELAKYHEWETGDLQAAREWTLQALRYVATWRPSHEQAVARADLEQRLARLDRKIAR